MSDAEKDRASALSEAEIRLLTEEELGGVAGGAEAAPVMPVIGPIGGVLGRPMVPPFQIGLVVRPPVSVGPIGGNVLPGSGNPGPGFNPALGLTVPPRPVGGSLLPGD